MSRARAERRSVFLFHHYTNEYLGGFWQNGSVTERNLLHILNDILIDVKGDFEVRARHRGSGEWVEWCDDPVFQGQYSVICKGKRLQCLAVKRKEDMLKTITGEFKLNNEQWFVRLDSFSMSGGEEAFKNGIRKRDGRCVVSGEVNEAADLDIWAGYEAAHVFPLEYEEWWDEQGFGTCISDMDNTAGASKINSVQNGMLMTASLHTRFDQYLFTVNPDVRHPTLRGSTLCGVHRQHPTDCTDFNTGWVQDRHVCSEFLEDRRARPRPRLPAAR